ncbi:RNA recognition motif domain protein family protein [Cryptosporidium meleagridis]|uniref:RNA recognition motif domain protein family protein n=1 Tax=Cryptosporidium meleagridis TaxID=93969 RepID=A0A2P4Z3R8_9CRYT|nr:RNA recognition motif domain protein family protein [Cryptosporidium meleagridis]
MHNRSSYKGERDVPHKRRNTVNEINSREEIYSSNYYNTRSTNYTNSNSWHDNYKNSSYIYISGLDLRLTEGDIAIVFSQWGEPVDINLIRDKKLGISKGYCFLCYEDQKSTILAVDNANDMILLGKHIKVDHVRDYKPNCDGEYIFTGAEGGGIGVFGVTKDIQARFKTELEILNLNFSNKTRTRTENIEKKRRIKSLSRSLSLE